MPCFPGATVPYGQIQVCPDSKPRQHPGYDFEVPTISGFSINRLSGVGGSGCGGNVSLMPDATGQDVRLLKHTEQAYPGYYSVQLSNGVWFTATANYRIAAERFSFPSKEKAVLLLNPRSAFDKVFGANFEQKTPDMGQGFADCANTCGRGHYLLHYRLYTSTPFVLDTIADGRKRLTFPELSAKYVEVRIVVSTGLADELGKMTPNMVWATTFENMMERAKRQWERLLSTVEVEGGTEDQQTIFYTSLLLQLVVALGHLSHEVPPHYVARRGAFSEHHAIARPTVHDGQEGLEHELRMRADSSNRARHSHPSRCLPSRHQHPFAS